MGIKKDYILFLFLLAIIVFTIYFLINGNQQSSLALADDCKPAYLSEPIPSLDELEVVINNPMFREMKYIQPFFNQVLIGQKGRINPFMPFVSEEKENNE
ncbi:hypothetical protein B6D52_02910 [Candidatus Parcubacteria bacterium 4484_255]|nr:MAG: hypothetical protein B6D52_02910 [Candidatus Parcubacteria bacterium 4484_255]